MINQRKFFQNSLRIYTKFCFISVFSNQTRVEIGILPSYNRVSTIVWLQISDSNETLGEKLDGNYTRILHAVLNKSRKQHSIKQQLCGHLSPISQTIQVRRARHTGEEKEEFISDVILWCPTVLANQQKLTSFSSVRTLDTVYMICLGRWWWMDVCLFVCLFLWHTNLCMLSNAKSILYKWTVLFQTIHFSLNTQFNCQKDFYFKQFNLVKQF